jgi:hypothetical protein
MTIERATRCLSKMSGASSNRVLNLNAIGLRNAENPAHHATPLFLSPVINHAIILKHTLRTNEADAFSSHRAIATKIIIPFERTNLRSGGRSMYVDQHDFEPLFRETGNYRNEAAFERDLIIMRLIDKLPSLDPFLLRERLRSNDIDADASYFEISSADQQRMHGYASKELSRLTNLVTDGPGSSADASTAKMVTALLSNEVNEKLEPMRATLGLNHIEFCEGAFGWRGFIYYKWTMSDFCPDLLKSLREIRELAPAGKMSSAQRTYFAASKATIIRGSKLNIDRVGDIIGVYDDAYGSLIERLNPKLFRDFLVAAPSLFLEIGEKMGSLYHVSSFWKHRFPAGSSKRAEVDELIAIFEDFMECISENDEGRTKLAA